MRVVVYFPTDETLVIGHTTDYRELELERVPLAGERLVLDDRRSLTVRHVTTVLDATDDGETQYHLAAS